MALCHSEEEANQVRQRLEEWLGPRGLTFNEEKTCVVHLDEGFDFLGFNVRRYSGKLLIKPSKEAVKRFRGRLRAEKMEEARTGEVTPEDREETAIGQSLNQRPARSVLIDDRVGYRIIARAGTARPFLTPVDGLYALAVSQPARFVPSMLAPVGRAHVVEAAGQSPAGAHPGLRLTRAWSTWCLYESTTSRATLGPQIR